MNVQNPSTKEKTAAEIQDWLVDYIANLLEVEPEEIDPSVPFDRYGLNSSAAVGMTGDLEDWLQIEVDPILLYDYPTVETFADHLDSKLNSQG